MYPRSLLLLLLASLVACQAPVPKPSPEPVKRPVKPKPDFRAAQINSLLSDAEKALAANRLTIPKHNNALDLYRAVLAIDPNNVQANSGLQMIPLRYVEMSRNAAAKGSLSKAKTWLRRALSIDPDNAPAKTLLAKLQKVNVPAAAKTNPAQQDNDENLYLIDPEALKNKDESLQPYLQLIAQRAKIDGLLAIISAPTDAQGRWIYLQMKKALPGYRLRGDIRRGRNPQIKLETP
ncbi:tetratricopeptide repeat protein [Pseudoteredinibacter isoporae]|uniref:Tetratricopeptide (TPR) repeat protein n=1 Tax=Pseudoteredinibacter isoporae TaxID=570281 RepID=A0A7X0JQY3_9GAMM|nr:hypothetical protein [Pseudoteredinibacter isoporae]MBB6519745.1 tetratricopeptide (TPR) repeat protein [Pseudoteredinibacter isoporae]NHO85326.1 hypothetical protein [Pseudoteredinibacter isoporae]NIB26222.1 hypothetical protein [Pseudoteredinibacter isoporae]